MYQCFVDKGTFEEKRTQWLLPFHEYPVSKHFFGYESWRTCTHAFYQTIPTQTHWHDRLTLVPIPEKSKYFAALDEWLRAFLYPGPTDSPSTAR